jgi:hypothetical protein
MVLPIKDTRLALQALAYVHKLYAELMADHAAPGLGTQNQAVHFILDDPALRDAVAKWAETTNIEEASAAPSQKVPHDELYRRVREYLEKI